jgi:hypothetical protein
MDNTIKCKNCGAKIEVSEALRHQIEEQVVASLESKFKSDVIEAKKKAEEEISRKIGKELQEEKIRNKKLSEQLEELLDETRKLRRKDEDRDIEMKKKLLEAEDKIRDDASKKAEDKFSLDLAQEKKRNSDAQKQIVELQRKLQQGSQQLQGEVFELSFEQLLKDSFRNDQIEPVEKGVKGADVRQVVKSPRGVMCGVILWETKRTKAWKDDWIEKLKKDLRAEKANIPVIVSAVLPKEADNEIWHKDGVWISNFKLAIPLAQLLRKNLLDVGYQKAVTEHSGEKADHLYKYITSHEFRQQVEAMVEVYFQMKNQITKERITYEKMWGSREKQVDKLFSSTANVVGSIQGEVGQTAFQIKGLELKELDDGNKEKNK